MSIFCKIDPFLVIFSVIKSEIKKESIQIGEFVMVVDHAYQVTSGRFEKVKIRFGTKMSA